MLFGEVGDFLAGGSNFTRVYCTSQNDMSCAQRNQWWVGIFVGDYWKNQGSGQARRRHQEFGFKTTR